MPRKAGWGGRAGGWTGWARTRSAQHRARDVATVTVTDAGDRLTALALVADDVRDAGKVDTLATVDGGPDAELTVDVELAPAG